MKRLLHLVGLAAVTCGLGAAARCTTVLKPGAMDDYEAAVASAEHAMAGRPDGAELAFVPAPGAGEAAARLAAGKLVRQNLTDHALNQRIAAHDASILHWAGAVRIRGTSLPELRAVLEDYRAYDRIYRPMIFGCRAESPAHDLALGLHSTFRFISLFAQHFSFRVTGRMEFTDHQSELRAHLRSSEIRESDSGSPGRNDLLEPYHDHGIMWALNAWWRAFQTGPDVYLEFETITLARSVDAFSCKIGIVRIPKATVASAMDSIPAESINTILTSTKAECERRASSRGAKTSTE